MKYNYLIIILCCTLALKAEAQKKAAPKVPAKSAGASSPAMKQSIERGKIVYTTTCLPCHQADGGGVPNMNPPLSKTEYVLGDKTRLINIILKGLNEDVSINGDTYS